MVSCRVLEHHVGSLDHCATYFGREMKAMEYENEADKDNT